MAMFSKSDPSYEVLSEVLASLLAGQQWSVEFPTADSHSFLLLQTEEDAAAFVLAEENVEATCRNSYARFKHVYRDRHDEWADHHLSFVVCAPERKPGSQLETFLSQLESDVFFCRKYILHMKRDSSGLAQELERLPFIPVNVSGSTTVRRPLSALQLLRRYGVRQDVAENMALPQRRAAEGILEDLRADPPELEDLRYSGREIESQDEERETRRIRSVCIKGFRAYGQEAVFDVDADVVVLHGPNGLGKTSFFDAIDFACTGRIGRLQKRGRTPQGFMDLVSHRRSGDPSGHVTMEVSTAEGGVSLRRAISERKSAMIDGDEMDRGTTLDWLTSAQWGGKRPRIDNVENLFRATHLFSQAEPELLPGFRSTSLLSQDVVSRTLSLEDYSLSSSKVGGVLKLLSKDLKAQRSALAETRGELEEIQERLSDLPEGETVEQDEQLKVLVRSLVKSLESILKVEMSEGEEIVPSRVRDWRAELEARLQTQREALRELRQLEDGLGRYEEAVDRSETAGMSLTQIAKERDQQTSKMEWLDELIEKLASEEAERQRELERMAGRVASLHRGLSLKQQTEKLRVDEESLREEIDAIQKGIEERATGLKGLREGLEDLKKKIDDASREESQVRDRLDDFGQCLARIDEWRTAAAKGEELKAKESQLSRALEEQSAETSTKEEVVAGVKARLGRLESEFQRHESEDTALTRLLDSLEEHVKSGVCPACGAEHEDQAALLERIRSQKDRRPTRTETLAQEISDLRSVLAEATQSLSRLEEERTQLVETLAVNSRRQEQNALVLKEYEDLIRSLGLDPEVDELESILEAERAKLGSNIAELNEGIRLLVQDRTELTAELEEREKALASHRERKKERHETVERILAKMLEIQTETSELSVSIEKAESDLKSELVDAQGQHKKIASALDRTSQELKERQHEREQSEATLQRLKDRAEEEAQRREQALAEVSKYRERVRVFRGVDEISKDALSATRSDHEENVDDLEAALVDCLSAERILDASQRSAMRAELVEAQNRKASRERRLSDEVQTLEGLQDWLHRVQEVLAEEHSEAVSRHVEAIGPLASLLQRKLRSVYGFGDVHLSATKEHISVSVEDWNGDRVKPTDYFSESQKQILMLSLFLSTRLTQTWSRFAPIMLDDPVTHFDDLNAFGFVELLRGLTLSAGGARQFFISTCEERLFDLLRSKLGGDARRARFFRYEGIVRDGPIVEDVT